ncbi:hypothetical protein [Kitasatospora sp. NPDC093102]|uniref:hypothetical protein n=1 Tax=Kitasatospora sp. NPDC093102 TaxID=3155069 RepID=UPI003424CFF8
MVPLHGDWQITVVRAGLWPQRALIVGPAGTTVLPGTPGASFRMDAPAWELRLEHTPPEGGWQPQCRVLPQEPTEENGLETQLVYSKDRDWDWDQQPLNLVLRLERLGAPFRIARPLAVLDADSMRVVEDGVLTATPEPRLLAVTVRNTSRRALDRPALAISDAGRAALLDHGIRMPYTWDPGLLRIGRQQAHGRAVVVPPIEPGEEAMLHFPVDATDATAGLREIEFQLDSLSGELFGARAPRTATGTLRSASARPAPQPSAEAEQQSAPSASHSSPVAPPAAPVAPSVAPAAPAAPVVRRSAPRSAPRSVPQPNAPRPELPDPARRTAPRPTTRGRAFPRPPAVAVPPEPLPQAPAQVSTETGGDAPATAGGW